MTSLTSHVCLCLLVPIVPCILWYRPYEAAVGEEDEIFEDLSSWWVIRFEATIIPFKCLASRKLLAGTWKCQCSKFGNFFQMPIFRFQQIFWGGVNGKPTSNRKCKGDPSTSTVRSHWLFVMFMVSFPMWLIREVFDAVFLRGFKKDANKQKTTQQGAESKKTKSRLMCCVNKIRCFFFLEGPVLSLRRFPDFHFCRVAFSKDKISDPSGPVWISWWTSWRTSKNPSLIQRILLMVEKLGDDELRLVVYLPLFTRYYASQVVIARFLNHQQYHIT